ncbi:MAG TPA: peptide deformylase [Flavobacteriales bacterium]|nr:peptide deformylase [Flavobacteriales bacterium]
MDITLKHGIGALLHESDQILTQEPAAWIFDPPQADAERMHRIMIENMVFHHGLGLSANQIGMPVKVFAMRVDESNQAIVCFNPTIKKESDETVMMKEGCLSFPELFLNIRRPTEIEGQYQNADGDTIDVHFEGLAARIFHHEMDHMKGETFTDKVNKVFLQSARRKQKKLLRKGRNNGRTS